VIDAGLALVKERLQFHIAKDKVGAEVMQEAQP
jgi:hypothetical protein